MRDLITTEQNIKAVYDTNDNNKVVGLLDGSINSAAHEAISPTGIKVSTNSINSADGDVLYLEQISVDSNGLATRV